MGKIEASLYILLCLLIHLSNIHCWSTVDTALSWVLELRWIRQSYVGLRQMLRSPWLLFQCLDKEVEMKTCEEPRPPNGQSPIALASGQRLVALGPIISKSMDPDHLN